ncbi:MAG: TIGR04076 family protein [Patescibacteria group bacterium]
MTTQHDDSFTLFDLKVEVIAGDKKMVCSHNAGDYFEVQGENILLPPGQAFSQYALAALIPFLPAKQRVTHANDWMTTDAIIACPDPHCGAKFKITRTGKRTFRHSEVTVVPLNGAN